jgi:hypothetical protein
MSFTYDLACAHLERRQQSALRVPRGATRISCPATRARHAFAALAGGAGRGPVQWARAHMRGSGFGLEQRARDATGGGTGAGTAAHRLDLDRTALPRRARTCPRPGLHGGRKKEGIFFLCYWALAMW